jgi:hypothetical protein
MEYTCLNESRDLICMSLAGSKEKVGDVTGRTLHQEYNGAAELGKLSPLYAGGIKRKTEKRDGTNKHWI